MNSFERLVLRGLIIIFVRLGRMHAQLADRGQARGTDLGAEETAWLKATLGELNN